MVYLDTACTHEWHLWTPNVNSSMLLLVLHCKQIQDVLKQLDYLKKCNDNYFGQYWDCDYSARLLINLETSFIELKNKYKNEHILQHHELHRVHLVGSICVIWLHKFSITHFVLNVLGNQRHTVSSGRVMHTLLSAYWANTCAARCHMLRPSSDLSVWASRTATVCNNHPYLLSQRKFTVYECVCAHPHVMWCLPV